MKTNLKRILAFLLATLMLLAVVGCDDKKDESKDTSKEETTVETTEEASKETEKWTDTDENGNAKRDPNYEVLNYETMKGIWLSQYDMQSLYSVGTNQRNEESFTDLCDKICKGIAKEGFNTVIVQLRPNGDSFYPSDLFAPSMFVVGSYSKDKDFKYDPLKIFIKKAHKYNLSFHAWINPMRLMKDSDIKNIDDKYVIKQWYNDAEKRENYMFKADNDYWYLVPGWDDVRKLVCDGVKEICDRYNVDSVQIDDYFYPVTHLEFDKEHYALFKDQYAAVSAYRINMVNALVKQMYDTVHAAGKGLEFGISPAGNISNNTTALYADVRRWGKTAGYCDFLIPQVYWGFENSNPNSRFDKCSTDWQDLCTAPEVKLIIGISLDNCAVTNADGDNAEFYNNKDCIKKQLLYLAKMKKNNGFAMFSYQSIFNGNGQILKLRAETMNFIPVMKEFPNVSE